MEKEAAIQIEITPFRELPISDDYIFGHLMRDVEICRMFLEALLQKKIARIEIVTSQYDITDSYFSRGIRLDVYLADEVGTVYCVEMQTSGGTRLLFRRIRYYQSAIDRHHLQRGMDYLLLPESFIILICTEDLFDFNLPVYRRKIVIEDCEEATYNDGSHVYILNGAYRPGEPVKKKDRRKKGKNGDVETKEAVSVAEEDPAILEFLRCIRDKDTDKSHYSTPLMREICDEIDEVRDDPAKEAEYMQYQAKVMDIRREGRAEGREEGIRGIVETVQDFSAGKEEALRRLVSKFSLDPETARQKVELYWRPN